LAFLKLLEIRRLIVGDGAMGTQLMGRGLEPGECGELWNVENPHVVQRILAEYVEAGADFVLTNTFGANVVGLQRHGLADRTREINRAGAAIARRAAADKALVIGCLGPTGELLEPFGRLTAEAVRAAFAPQVMALAEAGVDAIICETFESSAELNLVLEAAHESCDLPLIACMKFTAEPSGRYRTIMGEGPGALASVAQERGCAVVGTNCGQGIVTMARLVAQIKELTDLPIMAEPNAGLPKLVQGQTAYPETPEDFSRHLPDIHEAGARIIGGCCGTTADHIRAIRAFADSV
jgi:5-methyltetrahydrofolate--homocysteine methyltransferase